MAVSQSFTFNALAASAALVTFQGKAECAEVNASRITMGGNIGCDLVEANLSAVLTP